ncbi:hypothetical protein XENTR_v10020349 [Xenopus tropicalis]|nr:hypothetical protein XENTR_v10020349 [Xenopus tropicalis]
MNKGIFLAFHWRQGTEREWLSPFEHTDFLSWKQKKTRETTETNNDLEGATEPSIWQLSKSASGSRIKLCVWH